MRIYGMRTNRLVEPVGFDLSPLRLSYKVMGAKGLKQAAACIRIFDSQGSVIYDSGMRGDIDSLCFTPEIALLPRRRYGWEVTVRTDAGEEGVSPRAWFETGKMHESWAGHWIASAASVQNTRLIRRFALKKPVKSARLYICGLGLYEASLNGAKIGEEYLCPGCNAYDHWIQYQTFDITSQLKRENELCVLLGDGWYKGRFGFQGQSAIYGSDQAMLCEAHILYADGSDEVIVSDDQWQSSDSPIRFANIYDGEEYDATFEPETEGTVRYVDEIGFDRLRDRLSPPVRVMHTLRPIEILTTPRGERVADMGQNMTGWLAFRDPGIRGKKYRLSFGEILQDGCFYNENLRSAKAEFLYTSDGSSAWVRPHFTFYGFRYVKLEGFEQAGLYDFVGEVLYSDIERTGFLKTSSDKVNKLAENTLWGQRGNFLDVPTDCPQRDERMGWTGDAQAFCATACFQMDSAAFFTKYLYDMAVEQSARDGAVPHVIPSFGLQGSPSCAWADAAAIIPWTLYQFYGDRALLEKQYGNMKAWAEWVYRLDEKTGGRRLWHAGFHFADWLALDAAFQSSSTGGTSPDFVASCYYFYTTQLTGKAARALGKTQDALRYEKRSEEIRTAIRREYLTASGRLALNTQTAYILALFLHLVTDEEAPAIRAALDRCFEDSRGELRTGFVGTAYLCRVLSENGMNVLAYSLFLRENYPGWLYEVNMGATTVWERWNSVLPNGKVSGTGMNSLNHYAYGAIMEWVYRCAAGLSPLEEYPGFRRVRIEPHPDIRLPEIDFRYESAMGTYRTAWKTLEDGSLAWTVEIPFGGEAELILPMGRVSGLEMEARDGKLRKLVPAGHYELVCRFDQAPWRPLALDVPFSQLIQDDRMAALIRRCAPDLTRLFSPASLSGLTLRKLRGFPFSPLPPEQLRHLETALTDACFHLGKDAENS